MRVEYSGICFAAVTHAKYGGMFCRCCWLLLLLLAAAAAAAVLNAEGSTCDCTQPIEIKRQTRRYPTWSAALTLGTRARPPLHAAGSKAALAHWSARLNCLSPRRPGSRIWAAAVAATHAVNHIGPRPEPGFVTILTLNCASFCINATDFRIAIDIWKVRARPTPRAQPT